MASTTKQFHRLLRTIANFSNGQAAVPEDSYDLDNELTNFRVILKPTDGPYRGGSFEFEIEFDEDYPDIAPVVRCLTSIYHPNIDFSDCSVCLNLLDDEWTPELTFEDVVQGLLFLLYNPNVSDPLSQFFEGTESDEFFMKMVRKTLRGGEFFGETFPRNLNPEYEDDGVVDDEDEESARCQPETSTVSEDSAGSDDEETGSDDQTNVLAGAQSDISLVMSASVVASAAASPEGDQSPRDCVQAKRDTPLVTLKSVGRQVARVLRTAVEIFGKYG